MTTINHEKYAKNAIVFLINHIAKFKAGDKFITYGEFARAINYPEPHIGSYFGNNIGQTLGILGHMIECVDVPNWNERIPFLQALIVAKDTKLPSDGLKEFKKNYADLSKEKKSDFVKLEYKKIFQFGERWYMVLETLHIDTPSLVNHGSMEKGKKQKKYNPFGSEGSPEHHKLRDHIASNPDYIGLDFEFGTTEYPQKSGDSIDIVFQSNQKVLGIEVKSIRSGNDDLERGIFQCIKYREVLKAENKLSNKNLESDCILVYEGDMDDKNIKSAKKLNVKYIKVAYNK